MHLENLLSELKIKFKINGSFNLLPGESINKIAKNNKIPSQCGVYIIYGCDSEKKKVIYIGKSGTIKQDGKFRSQKLKGRLTATHGKVSRKIYFQNIIKTEKYSKLFFKWFITFDSQNKLLPANIEGDLMQAYYDDFKCLPKYNKDY